MSTTEMRSPTTISSGCPQCGQANGDDAKFCAHCGTSLWAACQSCKQPSRIGQPYCGHCGFHLAGELQRRRETAMETLARARQLFEQYDFDEAASLAGVIAAHDERDFIDIAKDAKEFVAKVRAEKQQWDEKLTQVSARVSYAVELKDHEAVVEILHELPEAVLSAELHNLLRNAQSHVKQHNELRRQLQKKLQAKDYIACGGILDQLLALLPDSDEYQKLAKQVGQALSTLAERRFRASQYADALHHLDAIPLLTRDEDTFQQMRITIDNISWVTEQIARSPWATPTLGRLVQRLMQIAPHDERAPKLVQQLAERVRGGSKDPLSLFGGWVGSLNGWRGGPVAIAASTRRIRHQATLVKQHPTRFSIAIGLALQGIQCADFESQLLETSSSGLLRGLLKRKVEIPSAWGVDVGSTAIRAVLLQRNGDQLEIAKAILLPFDPPLCRTSVELRSAVVLREKLDQLAAHLKEHESPVWTNLSTRESLGRFVKLPPVGDKQLEGLIQQEMASQFPLGLDQLVVSRQLIKDTHDNTPRVIMVAAKRQTIEQRQQVFKETGIEVSGIQCDAVALHNYVRYEYGALLGDQDAVTATPDAVVYLDAGATGTTMYVTTKDAFWFRYVDGGGEDLTVKLAGERNLTHEQAEAAKLEPWKMERLSEGMSVVDARIAQHGSRIAQYFHGASDFLGELRVKRIFCGGGSALTHGWTRHVFANRS